MQKYLPKCLALLAFLALGACSATQLQVACATDQSVQPVAASVVATLVPQTTGAVAIDNGLIHPAIVAYCASLGAKAVTVPVTPAK